MSLVVRKSDVLAAGFCSSGLKTWCRQHGITADEINRGVPADRLLATGCDLAAQVVAKAASRAAITEHQE